MSLLPMAIVDALAGKIARTITPALQSALRELTDHSPSGKSAPSFFQRMTSTASSVLGGGSSGEGRTSSPAPAKLPAAISRSVNPPIEKSAVNKLIEVAEKRSAVDQNKSGQSFWKRGWGTLQNGQKRSVASRAARLTTIAARRLSSAKKAVSVSNKNRNSPGWHPAAHGQLLANKNAAAQKLTQATALQAKSTLTGAISSGRVASGLFSLASKIPMLAARLSIPLGIAYAAVKAPFILSKMNDDRIQGMREQQRYSSRLQTALASYDSKTQNIKALNAREAEPSNEFLIEQQNKLRTTLRPYQQAFSNLATNAQGYATLGMNKLLELEQFKIDIATATAAEAADIVNGNLPNPGDIPGRVKKIQDDRKKQEADEAKVKSEEFQDVFSALISGSLAGKNVLDNARHNNVSIPPIVPIR